MWQRTAALIVLIISSATCGPIAKIDKSDGAGGTDLMPNQNDDVEKSLETFLQLYYDKFIKPQVEEEVQELKRHNQDMAIRKKDNEEVTENIYDRMQGDQPNAMEGNNNHIEQNIGNFSMDPEENSTEFYHALRIKKQNIWLDHLKDQILHQIGRDNASTQSKPSPETPKNLPNLTDFLPHLMNLSSTLSDDQITEKIRSFYPSCEKNVDTDHELWKDENIMNLYFNFDYATDQKAPNIATATLRLYRLPNANNSELNVKSSDCDFNLTEDEKLMRVSIYWYTKTSRKRRVKRRLSDSKVISENTKWVELCVKPATKAWSKGKNFGLGISVEDQEGNPLKADKYFKGPSCMVGMSTPKPIPTIVIDAARDSNELHQIHSLLGRNSTAALHSDLQLLPIMDICTLEFPDNYTQPPHISNLRINACNLKKMHEQRKKLIERERLERLATLPFNTGNLRFRHQKHNFDPRSRMMNSTVIINNEQLEKYKLNLTAANR